MPVELILFALVIVIAVLITVDVLRAPDELQAEQADVQAYEPDRAFAGASHAFADAGRAFGDRAFTPEPAGTVVTAAAPDTGHRRPPDATGPSAAGYPSQETFSAVPYSAVPRKGPRGALKNWPVRVRLFLLVIVPAVAAAIVALSAVHMASSLRSTSFNSPISSVRDGAIASALVAGVVLIIVLALALAFTMIVARSVLQPLRKLRRGALEVADARMPETVHRIAASDGEDGTPDEDPIGVDSSDEIGDVARAFDLVYAEVLRLAANEAALRGKLNAIFVNLSRRSQTLVERQIRLIDDLEQGEQVAERRANLFKLDHLVTRMRRYSQNLLVLAGQEPSGQPGQPMALVNVIRAAVSEVEEYERVSLNVQPDIAVYGPAVNDVVHMLAELTENATALSSADTPVLVSGRMLASGGFLIEITDRGFGMSAEEMAHANWRLDNPPVADITVFKSMGLSVVGRLAARHGIRIRLRQAESGGLTALVWLPNAVLLHQETAVAPGFSGFGAVRSRPDLAETGRHGRVSQIAPNRAAAE
jgi:signal transduction histidine kinase